LLLKDEEEFLVYQTLLADASFFRFLLQCDAELAEEAKRGAVSSAVACFTGPIMAAARGGSPAG